MLMTVDKVGGRAIAYRVPLPSHESNLSVIFDVSHKEKQRALRMLDGDIYVAQNYRGGVFFFMSVVPARPFPRRTPRPDGLATIVDGK